MLCGLDPNPRRRLIIAQVSSLGLWTRHFLDLREIAGLLRVVARSCLFPGARREILHFAARFESRAEHLDRRAGQDR